MCGGGRPQEHINAEAQRERDRLDRIAQERQRELDRLAEERTTTAAAQQAQLLALQAQQDDAVNQQKAEVGRLQGEQQQRLGQIRSAGTAVTQSLQILARQASNQAPTASIDDNRTRQHGARTTSASLRMGSGSYGTGAGANISV